MNPVEKYIIPAIAAAASWFGSLVGIFLFVGGLVISDFITGVIKAHKNNEVTSRAMIRKLYTCTSYFIGILVTKGVETFILNDSIPLVKIVCLMIAMVEIQSIRENINEITGSDILKPVSQILNKAVKKR